jgi:hypothetical protein
MEEIGWDIHAPESRITEQLDIAQPSGRNRILPIHSEVILQSIPRRFPPPVIAYKVKIQKYRQSGGSTHLELVHDGYNFVLQSFIGHFSAA